MKMSAKDKKVGISIGGLQAKYGDKKALELAKKAGADTVDFSTDMSAFDYRDPKSVFAGSDDEIESYFNDNDTLTDQHKIPMTGTIDWKDVFSALSEVGYDGVYNMELNLRHFGDNFLYETAEFVVKVMRNMLEMYC